MSPEQLQGAPADARSDIFAFGLVLHEMLTGKRAFDGASAASIIAAILERPAPSVSEIAPPALDRLLKRCLAKDPDDRWQSARDIEAALELVAEPSRLTSVSQPTPLRTSSLWPWLAAGALAAALAALAFVHFREVLPHPEVVRFEIPAPEGTTIVSAPYLSPDGRSIAFVASGADGKRLIWVRRIDSVAARVLTGTENANADVFWSPESRFIAFAADGKLKKIDLSGGAAQVLCDTSNIAGGSWNADGVIIFSEFQRGLLRVPQTGGAITQLTTLDAAINEIFHALPQFLPDGRHFIFTAVARERANNAVYLATLDGKERKRLPVDGRIRVLYAPPLATAGPGHLIFLRDETLVAQPVDNVTFETAGEAVPLAELGTESALGLHSVSAEGTLAYRTGDLATATQLVWFDREGKALGTVGTPARYNDLSLSPDGTQLAVTRREGANDDIWLMDLARNIPTRFTFDRAQEWHPVWSPDGRRLAFSSTRTRDGGTTNGIFWKEASGVGNEEPVLPSDGNQRLNDWSPDGKFLLFLQNRPNDDLWTVSVAAGQPGGERKATAYLESPFSETRGQFYPVSRPTGQQWVAYSSNESGQSEIYVESFPRGGARKVRISTDGGMQPRWRRDGKELYFISLDRKLMAVDVTAGQTLDFGVPKALFQTRMSTSGTIIARVLRYDATADGKRFIINTEPESAAAASAPITVVLNWTAMLKK